MPTQTLNSCGATITLLTAIVSAAAVIAEDRKLIHFSLQNEEQPSNHKVK
jgi:hypothetical protein